MLYKNLKKKVIFKTVIYLAMSLVYKREAVEDWVEVRKR